MDKRLVVVGTDTLVRREAVAIRHQPNKDAPAVVAKGYGSIAQNIIDRAKANNVFVHESPELVEMLMQVNLDEQIPPALYAVVAELLAWLYSIESKNAQAVISDTTSPIHR